MTAAEVETLVAEERRGLEAMMRRFVHAHEDAEDAVALGAEASWRHRRRIDVERARGWWYVVAKYEAWRIAARRRDVQRRDPQWQLSSRAARSQDHDQLLDTLAALELLKPDEARALTARTIGLSYDEMSAVMGWTQTKGNRCPLSPFVRRDSARGNAPALLLPPNGAVRRVVGKSRAVSGGYPLLVARAAFRPRLDVVAAVRSVASVSCCSPSRRAACSCSQYSSTAGRSSFNRSMMRRSMTSSSSVAHVAFSGSRARCVVPPVTWPHHWSPLSCHRAAIGNRERRKELVVPVVGQGSLTRFTASASSSSDGGSM
jgi:DNA-directed RNA polymerase specialized sigma24 family protein